jgi:predicted MFS family arabinose efflux permease
MITQESGWRVSKSEARPVDVNGLRCLIALILLSAIGNGVLVIQPLAVGAMVDTLGFTDRQAGFIVFTELASFSVGSMVMSGLIHRLNRRHVAVAGIILFAVGNFLSALPKSFVPFLIIRIIPGFACALAIAAFVSTAVQAKVPDRVFGMVNAFSIGYSALLLIVAPPVILAGGLTLMYSVMAVLALVCLGCVRWIPPRSPAVAPISASTGSDGQLTGKAYLTMLVMVLIAMLLLYTGHGSVWAFQERIGTSLGIEPQRIGRILSFAMTMGIVGSLIAWRAGLAIGRIWPQVISLGLSIVAAILLVIADSVTLFATASALVGLTWFYGLPYQMGILAQLDPRGRANVMGIIMTTGGAAIGPALAGVLVSPGEYSIVGWVAASCYTLCLLFVLPAVIFLSRSERAPPLPART